MRNWVETLRSASFRGVPFYVESEGVSAGRNIVVHEHVRSEEVWAEDMGRKATRYRVNAYVANDLADIHGQALIAALTVPGAGMLVLPMAGPVSVMISGDIGTNHERSKLGYFGIQFEAVEAGGASLFPSLPLGNRLAATAAGTIAGAARTYLGGFRP
ncbi:DNA circularization N-terminal domain-containing protein [Microvirga zambiensis]|uniref:DNA circularization N-terminal domain-containing protein n=1 Tax=Microvirga zambiensis TaxID=1402137 RepID=UPI001FEC4F55|nr:DNA circularization N-terminal domain-containing protein [Microvirga zambiensis]